MSTGKVVLLLPNRVTTRLTRVIGNFGHLDTFYVFFFFFCPPAIPIDGLVIIVLGTRVRRPEQGLQQQEEHGELVDDGEQTSATTAAVQAKDRG
jgi:hypothetical protein